MVGIITKRLQYSTKLPAQEAKSKHQNNLRNFQLNPLGNKHKGKDLVTYASKGGSQELQEEGMSTPWSDHRDAGGGGQGGGI
jgi:hypothetical protein